MSLTNQTIVEEIIARIGREKFASIGIQPVLRQMEQVYFNYNRRFLGAVKNSLEIEFLSTATAPFTSTLPADFLQPYFIDPEASWRHKKVFNDEEAGTFTIDQGVIEFVGAAGITFTIEYFSRGKYLEILDPGESAKTTHVTTPEWKEDFHWLLMLATVTRLSNSYEMYKQDLLDRKEYERQLKKEARISQQAARPIIEGPRYRRSAVETDAYSPNYEGNYYI